MSKSKMSNQTMLLLTFLLLNISVEYFAQNKSTLITYIHPKPGAEYITPQSSILIKIDNNFNKNLKLNDFHFLVVGEKSGLHPGETIISDNTIIFKPDSIFSTSENIFVSFFTGIPNWKDTLQFSFATSSIKEFDQAILLSVSDDEKLNRLLEHTDIDFEKTGEVRTINGVSVPSDFPQFAPSIFNEGTADGRIFLNNWLGSPYIMILENDGTPYFYQRVENRARDFKVQLNGMLTRRYITNLYGFVGMDSNYTVIDTFLCTNGYGTDEHEIYMLEDGHYFLIALGYRQVDMSLIVPGGDPNATVIDNHIQEFDENHNLVFEWLCYDHDQFNITNAIGVDFTQHTINYIHMNSIAIDYDGNIVISSRHQSKVVKINRQTGDVIWELGGLHSDFDFINDSYGISYQHFARPVDGKPNHYTVFDNGNFHNPPFSRAVEFQIDTLNMTATKVWEYRHTPDRYSHWMGNVQRLPNGNTLINYADGSLPAGLDKNSLLPIDTSFNRFTKITELENHTRYYFAAAAIDSMGIVSPLSNIESALVNFTPPGENFIINGDFSAGGYFWIFNVFDNANASGRVNSSGEYEVNINNGGTERWYIQLSQENIPLIYGRTYQFEFDYRASSLRILDAKLERNGPPYENYSQNEYFLVTTQMKHYSLQFQMQYPSDFEARVMFNCGAESPDLFIDNVSVKEIVTSIEEENEVLVNKYFLNNNYPNPFNPTTNIEFQIADFGYVTVKVYDVLGKEVKTLIKEDLAAGNYNVDFNANNLTSGIYFYRLSVNNFNITKKMVLIK
ncbi:MAG: aryl-sulfate sulfotransferase [Ignavibacteriaceae bacterium]